MSARDRWIAAGVAAALVVVGLVGAVYYRRHHQPAGTPPQNLNVTPAPTGSVGPTPLYVVSVPSLQAWIKRDPGENVTFRAIQGIANRAGPSIFLLQSTGPVHDQDWLDLMQSKYGARVVSKQDSTNRITDLTWFVTRFRPLFAGYVLFDLGGHEGSSVNVALSVAGAIDAIPIEQSDSTMIQAAKDAGLRQVEDVRGRDYTWLKGSKYWSHFNRSAIYFNAPNTLSTGADLAVAQRMAVYWDDVRSDPSMSTMASMLSDQKPGGVVFGWGYTDAQYREDIFVAVSSRFSQGLMDTPANLSVYMHYPLRGSLAAPPRPPLPTDRGKHYVAFVYSDGDNPRVIFNELTKKGNDRYESPLRGRFPVGWTLPPTIPSLAGPVVSDIFASATPNDDFVAGPSGFGYAFPSLIPQKQLFATQTEEQMATLDLSNVLVLDMNGGSGFTHQALDPLTAESRVQGVFFTAFNGRQQPPQGSVLWSNGKPVLPTVTLQRRSSQQDQPIANAAAYLNAAPADLSSPAGYTIVYTDFWTISMTDLWHIVQRLGPTVEVVRPDVLAAMVAANVSR
ncbi:MAG TPA: GxGYxYP domain-containing protein [Candidatus Dormibacteraeota bacterium]|nr:GxGYxYP domain-containing protein [Candidatus Dormibacteraeota bacterium]